MFQLASTSRDIGRMILKSSRFLEERSPVLTLLGGQRKKRKATAAKQLLRQVSWMEIEEPRYVCEPCNELIRGFCDGSEFAMS